MTIIEKKRTMKKAIDALPDEHVDEAFLLIEELLLKDSKHKEFVTALLKTEENLFKRLSQ